MRFCDTLWVAKVFWLVVREEDGMDYVGWEGRDEFIGRIS